jgi:catechol 2,3-dioxygenase-like lactoylglutathione lyase family enzyme
MPPQLAVVSLWTENVPETAKFYRDVIGLEMIHEHTADRVHFRLGEHRYLVLLKGTPHPATDTAIERFPVVAFEVDDLEKAVERLAAHGVETLKGIEEDSWSRWVMLHDPAGNLIELAVFTRSL